MACWNMGASSGCIEMKPVVRPRTKTLSISLDTKDINGNEILTIKDATELLKHYRGYIDGDRRTLELFVVKQR